MKFTIAYPTTGLTLNAGVYDADGKIWSAIGSRWLDMATDLASVSAWRLLLHAATEIEFINGNGATSIYQTVDIEVTGYDEVIFYSGNPPYPYNAVASLSTPTTADTLGVTKMGEWLRSLLSGSIINVISTSPVTQSDMSIVSGDSYDSTTNQPITFADDHTWPTLSPTNTICVVSPLSDPLSTLFTTTCVVTGNTPNQVVSVPFTSTQTALLVPGNVYYHKVKSSLSNTEVRTLVVGQITAK